LPLTALYLDFGRRSSQLPASKPVRNRIQEIERQAESAGMKHTFYQGALILLFSWESTDQI